MIIRLPTKEEVEIVRQWRNNCLISLRTPYPLSPEMQEDFYKDVICNRSSRHRFFSIEEDGCFVGFGGLTDIQSENRIAEISLIVNPDMRHNGIGEKCVEKILDYAFKQLNLKTVFGECYECNLSGKKFWEGITKKYKGYVTMLPNRKFWDGKYHNSLYFSIGEI